MRWNPLRWVWPDSLFGRLVVILSAGMFAGQLLTGTIWYETHDNRTLEIPARLFASRLADTVRLLEHAPDDATRDRIVAMLTDARYRLAWVERDPAPMSESTSLAQRATAELIEGVIRKRLGESVELQLISSQLADESGRRHGMLSLFDSRMPTGEFHALLRAPGGRWLDIEAHEGQAGMHTEPASLVLEYVVRLYALRFIAILAIAFIAVRFALEPLRRLARAADSLGSNIYRAPLSLEGPREVRGAAQSFNAMQKQLLDAFSDRTRFLSAVSHDLRSPLTRLRLRAEMLPDPTWRERLRGDLDEMEAMVRATLDAVQGVEVTESRERIDLYSMLDSVVADAVEVGHDAKLTGATDCIVEGFPRNLKRCIQNLVDNAIRHGHCAHVELTKLHDTVQIVFADRGPGIADERLIARVFEPYFRIDRGDDGDEGNEGSASGARYVGERPASGTGLGLTIAQSVARVHGGSLTLRNRRVGGTIVGLEAVLILPRAS